MALTPAEKQRRYRERHRNTGNVPGNASGNAVTDDIPFSGVTVTKPVTKPVTENVTDVAAAVTAVVTNFAQQHRRWISDLTDRIAVMENLILELAQSHNQLHAELRNPVTRYRNETPDVTVTAPPVTTPERPRGPISQSMQGFRPVGSVLSTSLKNLPQPPMDNPYGKDPDKPT